MKKKMLLLSFSLVITFANVPGFATEVKASESFIKEDVVLQNETETVLSDQELASILGDTNEVYLSEDTIDFIANSDFLKAREELDIFIEQNGTLTIDEINQKAAEILTEVSLENRQKAMTNRSYLPEAYNDLNSEEKRLVALYPGHAIVVYDCSTKALTKSSSIFHFKVLVWQTRELLG